MLDLFSYSHLISVPIVFPTQAKCALAETIISGAAGGTGGDGGVGAAGGTGGFGNAGANGSSGQLTFSALHFIVYRFWRIG